LSNGHLEILSLYDGNGNIVAFSGEKLFHSKIECNCLPLDGPAFKSLGILEKVNCICR
jgi:hypothetical protein